MLPYVFWETEEMEERFNYASYEKNQVLGLQHGTNLLGTVEYREDGDGEIFIELIHVIESFRNQGHAERLLNKLLEWYPETLAFTGLSTPHAVTYWQKKGVLFEPETFQTYHAEKCEQGDVFPFALKVKEAYQAYWLNQ